MKNLILSLLFSSCALVSSAQFAPDFTVTDTDGNEHNLYDYLNQQKTVVIKLFFVNCPPCSNLAPFVQDMYETWGSNEEDVIFLEFSTKETDSNSSINSYFSGLNLTIPASGNAGGGYEASEPYRQGDFGTYWGTPAFAVIAPDRNVVLFESTSNLGKVEDAILETGATGGQTFQEPTSFTFNFSDAFGEDVSGVDIFLIDTDSDNFNKYLLNPTGANLVEIMELEDYDGIENPAFRFEKDGPFKLGLSALDLITIQKHILELDELSDPDLILAADVTGDDKISALDLISIQKVILDLVDFFPNGLSNWVFKENDVPFSLNPGGEITYDIDLIKRGNVRD